MHRLMWLLLLGITWLGGRYINADSLWYDEIRSAFYAGWHIFGNMTLQESILRIQAPAYYLVLNVWGKLLGHSDYAGRVLFVTHQDALQLHGSIV